MILYIHTGNNNCSSKLYIYTVSLYIFLNFHNDMAGHFEFQEKFTIHIFTFRYILLNIKEQILMPV